MLAGRYYNNYYYVIVQFVLSVSRSGVEKPRRLPGGDDLEDDDYYNAEDVPALPGADNGLEDMEAEGEAGVGGVVAKRRGFSATAKKVKVVVF